MSSRLIRSRKGKRVRKADISGLPTMMRNFCWEMQADELRSPVKCAKRAGYKNAPQMAYKLMKHPVISQFLEKLQKDREERCKLTSDKIWEYLGRVLFHNPVNLFEAGGDGWYMMDLSRIPEEIGQMIEEVEITPTDEGNKIKVRLVSKAKALEIAAKHALPQSHIVAQVRPVLDYEELSRPSDLREIDVVANRLSAETKESKNGDT